MLKKLAYYINPFTLFRKQEENYTHNKALRTMNWINRIAIFMFLVCMVILLVRYWG